MITELLNWSFWPSIFAFLAVAIAFYVLGDFVVFTMTRYRERYLVEASTELDDILLQLPAGRVMDCSLAASAFVAFLSVIILMAVTGDFVWLTSIFVGLGSGAVIFPLPRLILRLVRQQRLHKFNLQLEDALGEMSSSLKAGFSINQALDAVAAGSKHPISVEFRLLMQEVKLGVSLEKAMENMNKRLGSEDFDLVSTAIITARQTGGELTSTLERLAGVIRERVRINNKLRAMTAQGKMQAFIICLMPFALLFLMMLVTPDTMAPFLRSIWGILSLALVVVLDVLGYLVIRKITTIDI
ncbi:MAG: type II secretion system F family protein [Lentisphaeria bacterium]|nr:type II secretion system F family protein [Lentisphaeria bacterium]